MLTADLLQRVYGLRLPVARGWVLHLQDAAELADLSSSNRLAAFIAQVGHESGCLRYVREIWGQTDQQKRYEPHTTLASKLGNRYPGDGARYLGRGLIQTTGRANYSMTTVLLRTMLGNQVPDFEAEPMRLEQPYWAAMSAGLYWRFKHLNEIADRHDFMLLTKRINGGYNGLAHRQALYTQALGALT